MYSVDSSVFSTKMSKVTAANTIAQESSPVTTTSASAQRHSQLTNASGKLSRSGLSVLALFQCSNLEYDEPLVGLLGVQASGPYRR